MPRQHFFSGLGTALVAIVGGACVLLSASAQQGKPLRIGIAKSFLTEQPKSIVDVAADDFKGVMKKTTQLDGTLITNLNASEVAEKLASKALDFGILHAHEFAAVQKKVPGLTPLLIAANKHAIERVYLIVRQDNPAKTLADLRGKKIDMPTGTIEACRVYLDKHCDGKGPVGFFGSIEKSNSPKDALDDVARGKVQVAILGTSSLEFYKEVRGPVFEKNLRVLQESEEFPPAVLLYKPGTVDEKTVAQFRDGLLKAHTIPDGRDMMKSWNIESFALIPKDYDMKLAAVLKAYPPR